jgi:hypothetical protein
MWRPKGQLVSYVYFPGKETSCGTDWLWPGAFAGSEFKTIRFFVQVNDLGMALPPRLQLTICDVYRGALMYIVVMSIVHMWCSERISALCRGSFLPFGAQAL